MAHSCLKNLVLLLTTAPMIVANALAMDQTPEINRVVNKLTETMAIHAYNQTPNENTLVCGVGPAIQLLTTSATLTENGDEESTENLIRTEIHKGLGIPKTYQASRLLDQTGLWSRSEGVKHAHLSLVPQGNEDRVMQVLNPKWAVGVQGVDLSNPLEAAVRANQWASDKTKKGISQIAEEKDFPTTTAHVFLSALFVSAKWNHSASKTTMKFYGKSEPKIIKGFRDTQKAYIYESSSSYSYRGTPFKILNLCAKNDLYLAIKMYDDGSVSPITVEEFNYPATEYLVKLNVPFFKFEKGLDLTFLKETFPTLFSSEYQTTLTAHPASIGTFKQKNFIDVNEVGYKAGSVTMKGEYYLSSPPTPKMTLEINKPFSFIAFQKTKADQSKGENFLHLFSGTVVDFPGQTSKEDAREYFQNVGYEIDELKRNLRSLEVQKQKLEEQIQSKQTEQQEVKESLADSGY